jgi:hypothetical protein
MDLATKTAEQLESLLRFYVHYNYCGVGVPGNSAGQFDERIRRVVEALTARGSTMAPSVHSPEDGV